LLYYTNHEKELLSVILNRCIYNLWFITTNASIPTTQTIVVYRGVKNQPELLELKRDDIVRSLSHCFMSTSTSIKIAESYSSGNNHNCLIKFIIPKGFKVLDIETIQNCSLKQLLLPSGCYFKVLGNPRMIGTRFHITLKLFIQHSVLYYNQFKITNELRHRHPITNSYYDSTN